jgi:hypothetical protein
MKRKTTLSNKTKLATSLKRRLVVGATGMLVVVAVAAISIFNFNSKDSRANLYDDGQIVENLNLTSMCSENPELMRRWRINNPNDFDVAVEWDVYPNFQTGLIIAHPGHTFFYSNTIVGPNTVRIRWQNENLVWKQKVKASGGQTCQPTGCFVSEVVSYNKKKRNDGQEVLEARSIPEKAIGAPQNDQSMNFVSLGFGGDITLKFSNPIANGEGDDIKVTESTFGSSSGNCNRYPEKIQMFASQDGCNFVYLGEGCQDATFDLGVLSWAQYVKIKDISPLDAAYNNQVADGYDVDAVECLNGVAQSTGDDGLVAGSAQEVIQYNRGTRKNGTEIHNSRRDPERALGIPQNDDIGVNFVSLGFDGSLILKFDYAVFDGENADIQIYETSFGAPSCEAYGEKVYVEGSLNGNDWQVLGELCLDGTIDFASNEVFAIHYIKLSERSPMSEFPNSADGYDVDGVLALHNGCSEETRIQAFDNNSVPDEIAEIEVSPNPFRDRMSLIYESGSIDEKIDIKLFNYVGQMVSSETVTVPKRTKHSHTIAGSDLPKGVYIVTVESGGQKQSIKVIKN